ncbi:uncharacterized protein [Phaenicophaeus curvirostris]|uniref:uncharacterized protein n=1 Tax=Phaenicophaeus curvirostris TaxID=33595 RepID=UPI0037F0E66D
MPRGGLGLPDPVANYNSRLAPRRFRVPRRAVPGALVAAAPWGLGAGSSPRFWGSGPVGSGLRPARLRAAAAGGRPGLRGPGVFRAPGPAGARGLRFPACTALLTGPFQTCSGIYPGIFNPDSRGLPLAEVAVAELLKAEGYATAMVGKWHLGLGQNGSFLPTHRAFDHFLGVPDSHDQGPCQNLTCFPPDTKCFGTCDQGVVPVPLLWSQSIVQQPISFPDLVPLYNKFSWDFIASCARRGVPFLLYQASHCCPEEPSVGPLTGGGLVSCSVLGSGGTEMLHLALQDPTVTFPDSVSHQHPSAEEQGCAVGHEYVAEVGKHSSQTDAAKGFGGTYGVQRDRADKPP